MSAVAQHYRVDVSIGDEVHSFFTDKEPTYESVTTDNEATIIFVVLVPENGTSRGKLTRFPLGRVISVSHD